jgi:hypothetical protein
LLGEWHIALQNPYGFVMGMAKIMGLFSKIMGLVVDKQDNLV